MTRATLDSSAAPFTQAQIEFLAERDAGLDANREGWVKRQMKRQRNRALVGFLVLAGGIGGAIHSSAHDSDAQREAIVQSGQAIAVDGCNRDFVTSQRLQGILERGKLFLKGSYERGDIGKTAYDKGIDYYNEQLSSLPSPDCRKALTILTDDPDAKVRIPVPRYPGDPASRVGR